MAEYERLCKQYEARGATLDRNSEDRPIFKTLNRLVLEDMAVGDKEVACSTCPVKCNWENFGMLLIQVAAPEACTAELLASDLT